jgi:hypothetical protein
MGLLEKEVKAASVYLPRHAGGIMDRYGSGMEAGVAPSETGAMASQWQLTLIVRASRYSPLWP